MLKKYKIKDNNRGAAAILVTMLVLTLIVTVSLIVTRLMVQEIRISRDIIKSFKAYEAAMAGLERGSWEVKQVNYGNFSDTVAEASFVVTSSNNVLVSIGRFDDLERQLETNYQFGSLWIYAADTENHRIVRFDSGAGGTTFGDNWMSFGSFGSGGAGQFKFPKGITVDFTDNKIYVTDADNDRIVKFDSGTGGTTLGDDWESFGTFGSGVNQFDHSREIAIDITNDKIYIADAGNDRIAKFDSGSGGTIFGDNWESFGTSGSGIDQFDNPRGNTIDSINNKVYVSDTYNDRIAKFDSGSGGTIFGDNWESFGTSGSGIDQFDFPRKVAVDTTNNKIYVADFSNNRIAKFDSGSGGTIFGNNWVSFGNGGSGAGQFTRPRRVAIDITNNKLYVADAGNDRIAKFDSGSGGTIFGDNWESFGTSGSGIDQFDEPRGITVDAD